MIAVLAQTDFVAPDIDWWGVAPQLALLTGALVILLASALPPQKPPAWVHTFFSVLTSLVSLGFAVKLWNDVQDDGPTSIISGALGVDGFSVFVMMTAALVSLVAALLLHGYLERERLQAPEIHALVLSAAIGVIVMAQANDLIVLFLGLETLSLALYVMAASHLRRTESQESAVKYFVLGAFASAFFLYGIALVYGATGSTNLVDIRDHLSSTVLVEDGFLLIGIALIVVGLGFKVSAVPFHMWAPDVYQGAPTPIAGFMAATAKIGGFAALVRVLVVAMGTYADDWTPLIWVLAALSLLVGAVLAVVQTDVKRMLAYSSINHAGFMLVALESAGQDGTEAILFYLLTYSFLVLGSFGVLSLVSGRGDRATDLGDLAGLARRKPLLAGCLTLFLLAQAGVPFTSGFMAKFFVIGAAAGSESWILAAVAMLTAVVAAFFYLRVIVSMWLTDPDDEAAPIDPVPLSAGVGLAFCVAVTLVAGIVPQVVLDVVRDAVPVLVSGPVPGL